MGAGVRWVVEIEARDVSALGAAVDELRLRVGIEGRGFSWYNPRRGFQYQVRIERCEDAREKRSG